MHAFTVIVYSDCFINQQFSFMVQVMSLISVLSLRSPENAARAIEAGTGDLTIQAMEKFPAAQQMQRNSCLMIRNLVARNPENRQVFLIIFHIFSIVYEMLLSFFHSSVLM